MSYISLYRKYRSEDFGDLIGQEHIVRTISNSIENNKIAQGYLFCGTRGTGKTTVARIIAKALNCEKGPTSKPCCVCPACVSIKNGTAVDVYEMDAASNRGVDNVEAIVDSVKYRPTSFRYKVYIIDEAHQLSNQAKDAFLKTLEEPPPYAVFILATTEAHKIPVTIRSRCQQFDFRRGSISDISGRLAYVAECEQIKISGDALTLIARAANGSYRDSLSILEQIISFTGSQIEYSDVTGVLGLIEEDVMFEISEAIHTNDMAKAFIYSDNLITNGKDIKDAISAVAGFYRDLLAVKIKADNNRNKRWSEEAEKYSETDLVKVMDIFLNAEKDIRFTEDTRLVFELAFMKACSRNTQQVSQPVYIQAPVAQPIISSQSPIKKQEPVRIIQNKKQEIPLQAEKTDIAEKTNNNKDNSNDNNKNLVDIENFRGNWKKILEYLRQGHKKAQLSACAREGIPTEYLDGTLTITFKHDNEFHRKICERDKKIIEQVLEECYHFPIKLNLTFFEKPGNYSPVKDNPDEEAAKISPPNLLSKENTKIQKQQNPIVKSIEPGIEQRTEELSIENKTISTYTSEPEVNLFHEEDKTEQTPNETEAPLDNPIYDDHPLLEKVLKSFPEATLETIDK